MKSISSLILLFAASVFSQPSVTGYWNPPTNNTGTRLNTEQALNSATTVHTCVDADSVAIRPGVKWGSKYILKVIKNNSGSTQKLTIVDSTKETGLDTFHLNLAAYETSIPLPYSVLITGLVVDSTLLVRQHTGR